MAAVTTRGTVLMYSTDHRFHSFGIGYRDSLEPRLRVPRINPNRRVLQDVLIPLRLRAVHWQQVQRVAFCTNQTGFEIVLPDFLPITLSLIWL